MIYVQSTEGIAPLRKVSVDAMFTLNAFDYVEEVVAMSGEIAQVMKDDGLFVDSLNLDKPSTATEPNTLTEGHLRDGPFSYFETLSLDIDRKYSRNAYAGHMGLSENDKETGARVLWFVGRKAGGLQMRVG